MHAAIGLIDREPIGLRGDVSLQADRVIEGDVVDGEIRLHWDGDAEVDVMLPGCRAITPLEIESAREFGYRIKLLGITKRRVESGRERLEVRVHPTMIPAESLLAKVDGAMNAIAVHGDAVAYDLVTHKEADLAVKQATTSERAALVELRAALEREQGSPHRIEDLAVDGADLIAAGFAEGPILGRVLGQLLDVVIEDSARNEREQLLDRARAWLP